MHTPVFPVDSLAYLCRESPSFDLEAQVRAFSVRRMKVQVHKQVHAAPAPAEEAQGGKTALLTFAEVMHSMANNYVHCCSWCCSPLTHLRNLDEVPALCRWSWAAWSGMPASSLPKRICSTSLQAASWQSMYSQAGLLDAVARQVGAGCMAALANAQHA